MNKRKTNLLKLIKILILSILFYVAVYFENASGNRLNILFIIFIAYILIGVIRSFIYNKQSLLTLSFLLDISLIYLLEHNSRFLINYFFHSFYIVILLEVALTLKRDKSLIISVITVVVSLIKYMLLISYNSNLANFSEMAFFILINALILVVTSFAQYNKEEKEKKDLLYKELLNTHKKLKEYADKAEELAVIAERNRIARDIHDTLGHNMTALIMKLEMSSHMMNDNMSKAKELLENAKVIARDGLKSIRQVVETLRVEEGRTGISSIRELIDKFSNTGEVTTTLNIHGKPFEVHSDIEMTLYRIIQEALTNSVRHGKASKIAIELKYKEERIEFLVEDNGVGANVIKDGYGLKGMKERINSLNGKVEFLSENGFIVKGFIPTCNLEIETYN